MSANLKTLDLTPEELQSAEAWIRQTAYFHWLDAGRPEDGRRDFWLEAEREWISSQYVPHRLPEPAHSAHNGAP